MPFKKVTVSRWQVVLPFLLFVLFCMFFAWRAQVTTNAIKREHSDRIAAICRSENETRQGIHDFLHEQFKVENAHSPQEAFAVQAFLDSTDRRFAQKECKG